MALTIYNECWNLTGEFSLAICPWILVPPAKKDSRAKIDTLKHLVGTFGNSAKIHDYYSDNCVNKNSRLLHSINTEIDAAAVIGAVRDGQEFKSLAIHLSPTLSLISPVPYDNMVPVVFHRIYYDICRVIERSALTSFHCVVEQQDDFEILQSLQWEHLQQFTINFSTLSTEPEKFQTALVEELEKKREKLCRLEKFAIEANYNQLTMNHLVRILKVLPPRTLRCLSIKVPISPTEFKKHSLPWTDFSELFDLSLMISTESEEEAEELIPLVGRKRQDGLKFTNIYQTTTTTAAANRRCYRWTRQIQTTD